MLTNVIRKHYCSFFALMLLSVPASSLHATLVPVEAGDLAEVIGQGGADLNLELRWNVDSTGNYVCANGKDEYCRLAFTPDNRSDNVGLTGKKQWLVYKGVHGVINIQKVGLDEANISYTNDSAANVTRAALMMTFSSASPVIFQNFGFNSAAVETDTVAAEGAGNAPGYLAMNSGGSGIYTYSAGKYTDATKLFDKGREVGFVGLNINGALAMTGTMKFFGCDTSHPRC